MGALERGHLKVFGGLVRERMEDGESGVVEEIRKLGRNLPKLARAAEARRRAILEEGDGEKAQRVTVDHEKDVLRRFEWERRDAVQDRLQGACNGARRAMSV